MKRLIRSQLERRAPALFHGIRSIRNRLYFRRTHWQYQSQFRQALFPEGAAIRVQSGPFQGMHYLDETVWGSITPKWLGSYEAELHPVIRQIAEHSYQTIIDVGCAEGYYAVGLASLVPAARVFAFDTDFISRSQVRRLAALNNVADRLEVRAFCSHADLDALSRGATLVVCDIEGFETELLDPQLATAILRDDILVEIHETSPSSTEVEQLLQSRFETTHEIQRITACDRLSWIEHHQPKLTTTLEHATLCKATEENRTTGRVWLWMQAKGA